MSLFLVLMILFITNESFSQDLIWKKVVSVIDTTQSKQLQAEQIYYWITNNIQYDVDAFLLGKSQNKSVFETLKKKKGICYDYSLLFKEMCNRVNIECYIVSGYSKGATRYRENRFYRADHCWNVIHIDSTWMLADPTWGSGSIIWRPIWIDKLKYKLFNIHPINKRLVFIQSPTNDYFKPTDDYWKITHLPLDPKWQLTKYPISMKGFENDSLSQTIYLSNFKERLKSGQNLTESEQLYNEGLYGKEFNNKNNFDIAVGYLHKASEMRIAQTLRTETQLDYTKECLELCKKANNHILEYQDTIDSLYSQRIQIINWGLKSGKRMNSFLKNDYSLKLKQFDKTQYSLSRRQSVLKKKIQYFEWQISLLHRSSFMSIIYGNAPKLDSSQQIRNTEMLAKSMVKCSNYKWKIDTIFERTTKMMTLDSILTNQCLGSKTIIKDTLNYFIIPLLSEDNRYIYPFWGKLFTNFETWIKFYQRKVANMSGIQTNYFRMVSDLGEMRYEYKYQEELIRKYYRYSYDSLGTARMYQEMIESLLASYNKAKKLSSLYELLSMRNKQFHRENMQLNHQIQNPTKQNLSLFLKYGKMMLESQELKYKNEKKHCKNISQTSQRVIQQLTKKIEDFYRSQKSS